MERRNTVWQKSHVGEEEAVVRWKEVISGLDDRVKKNLRLSGQRIDIKALTEKISERYNISIGELRSGSRRRAVVKAMCAISWIGVRELGYSGADVARYLGVTNSCVTRLISAEGKQDIGHEFRVVNVLHERFLSFPNNTDLQQKKA